MSKRQRLPEAVRKKQILDAAIEESKEQGFQWVTRDAIAARAGVSTGLVTKQYSAMPQLKRAVMRAAIHQEILPIIAQGLTDTSKTIRAMISDLPADLRARALATIN